MLGVVTRALARLVEGIRRGIWHALPEQGPDEQEEEPGARQDAWESDQEIWQDDLAVDPPRRSFGLSARNTRRPLR